MSDQLWYQDTPSYDLPVGEVYGFTAGDMSSGATDYVDVAKYGISRFFDVASMIGQLQIVKNMPYMQTGGTLPNGQPNPLYAQQTRTNTMLLLIAAGIAVVMLARK
jgi:hypothetical protein